MKARILEQIRYISGIISVVKLLTRCFFGEILINTTKAELYDSYYRDVSSTMGEIVTVTTDQRRLSFV